MKKVSIGLLGALACTTMLNADGFSESDRDLIGAKDFPFPPGQEGSLPEADEPTQPVDGGESGRRRMVPREDDPAGYDDPNSSQAGEKSEKEYVPEVRKKNTDDSGY